MYYSIFFFHFSLLLLLRFYYSFVWIVRVLFRAKHFPLQTARQCTHVHFLLCAVSFSIFSIHSARNSERPTITIIVQSHRWLCSPNAFACVRESGDAALPLIQFSFLDQKSAGFLGESNLWRLRYRPNWFEAITHTNSYRFVIPKLVSFTLRIQRWVQQNTNHKIQ